MSTAKKTVLKVPINCEKCKKGVLKKVTTLTGINQVSVDAAKGTLTVVGDVDPVMIVKQIKKARKFAEIISVGPQKPEEKKPVCVLLPPCCKDCQLVGVSFSPYDGGSGCNIL